MQFPLFGFCQGDLCIFSDLAEAVAEIEPQDAKASAWKVYDAEGQCLAIEVICAPLRSSWPFRWLSSERVELAETRSYEKKMMEEDLRGYLLAIPESEVGLKRSWIETTSLDNLIGEARRLLRK